MSNFTQKELEAHSAMLSQISGYVAEYALFDEMTTVNCVRWVVASYKKLQAEKELDEISEIAFNHNINR